MLILERKLAPDEQLARNNCIAFDLPDGKRIRVWLQFKSRGRAKVVIDCPPAVQVRRGEHLGTDAEELQPERAT